MGNIDQDIKALRESVLKMDELLALPQPKYDDLETLTRVAFTNLYKICSYYPRLRIAMIKAVRDMMRSR